MKTYIAALPRAGRKPRTREVVAENEVQARRQAGTYWRIRVGSQQGILVTEKGALL